MEWSIVPIKAQTTKLCRDEAAKDLITTPMAKALENGRSFKTNMSNEFFSAIGSRSLLLLAKSTMKRGGRPSHSLVFQ